MIKFKIIKKSEGFYKDLDGNKRNERYVYYVKRKSIVHNLFHMENYVRIINQDRWRNCDEVSIIMSIKWFATRFNTYEEAQEFINETEKNPTRFLISYDG